MKHFPSHLAKIHLAETSFVLQNYAADFLRRKDRIEEIRACLPNSFFSSVRGSDEKLLNHGRARHENKI